MVLNLKLIRARTENAKRKWEILLYDLRHFGSKEEENVEVSKFFCKRYFEPKIGLFWAVVKANQMWRKRCRFYAKSHILKTSRPPSQLWQEASLKNPTKWLINRKKKLSSRKSKKHQKANLDIKFSFLKLEWYILFFILEQLKISDEVNKVGLLSKNQS